MHAVIATIIISLVTFLAGIAASVLLNTISSYEIYTIIIIILMMLVIIVGLLIYLEHQHKGLHSRLDKISLDYQPGVGLLVDSTSVTFEKMNGNNELDNKIQCNVISFKKIYNNSGNVYKSHRFRSQSTQKICEPCTYIINGVKVSDSIKKNVISVNTVNENEYISDVVINLEDKDTATIKTEELDSPAFFKTLECLTKEKCAVDYISIKARYPTRNLKFEIKLSPELSAAYEFDDTKQTYKYKTQTGDLKETTANILIVDNSEQKMANYEKLILEHYKPQLSPSHNKLTWSIKSPIVGYRYILYFTLKEKL